MIDYTIIDWPAYLAANTTLNVVDGAVISGGIHPFNYSTLNISGGKIGGIFQELAVYPPPWLETANDGGSNIFSISGGEISVFWFFDGRGFISGGKIGLVYFEASYLLISGGTMDLIQGTTGNGTVEITGGTFLNAIEIGHGGGNGDMHIKGGHFERNFIVYGENARSELTFYGDIQFETLSSGDSSAIVTVNGTLLDGTSISATITTYGEVFLDIVP